MAKDFKGKLIERIRRTETIESFRFLPEEKVSFIPGQFLQVIFDQDNPNNKELNKYLSFSSSPSKEYIEVTKRLSLSKFSQKLKSLNIADFVSFQGPLGNCVLVDNYKKIGFLIGGIGITPVVSIIEYIVNQKMDTDVVLAYSNRNDEDIAFRKELDRLSEENKNIQIIYFVTDCQPKDNSCISGRISKDLLIKKIPDLDQRIFFIFGPPKMVEAMRGLCIDMGCKKEDVKIENFIGY